MSGEQKLAMRLAIRAEGDFVNAYHAAPDTMAGATLLGSIRRTLCEQQPDLFQQWKGLMSEAYSRVVEATLGYRPVMTDQPAPEHERSGRA